VTIPRPQSADEPYSNTADDTFAPALTPENRHDAHPKTPLSKLVDIPKIWNDIRVDSKSVRDSGQDQEAVSVNIATIDEFDDDDILDPDIEQVAAFEEELRKIQGKEANYPSFIAGRDDSNESEISERDAIERERLADLELLVPDNQTENVSDRVLDAPIIDTNNTLNDDDDSGGFADLIQLYDDMLDQDSEKVQVENSDEEEDKDDGEEGDNGFLYASAKKQKLTLSDLLSYAMLDITSTASGVSRRVRGQVGTLINHMGKLIPGTDKPRLLDQRTILRRLKIRTGIDAVRYDCCVNSCMAFIGPHEDIDTCRYCKHPPWKAHGEGQKKNPFQTFDYIPLIHSLRLQCADIRRSKAFDDYKISVARGGSIMKDIWDGELIKDLTKDGLFSQATDMALGLLTDGVQVFKIRSKFSVWPVLIMNFNLPPHLRYLSQDILVSGIIPGPKNPKDINSFLYPLVQELLQLEKGIKVWYANQR